MSEAASRGPAPHPEPTATAGDIARSLVALRIWAGEPSFTEVARRIAADRKRRGVPEAEATIARSTIYDCFRPGRRRVNRDLVLEVVRALGVDDVGQHAWREAVLRGHPGRPLGTSVASTDVPADQHLLGRDDELHQLLASSGTVLVTGMPGVGKTALVLGAARIAVDTGLADKVVRINLAGFAAGREPVQSSAALDALLTALSAGPVPAGDPLRIWQRLLSEQSVLLVLDDVASAAQVDGLIPEPGSPSRAILTSRLTLTELEDLDGFGALTRLVLRELDEDSAVALLDAVAGGIAGHDSEALQLVRTAGGLPLGLVLLGERLSASSDWDLADHVASYRRQAEHLRLTDGVRGSIALSYDALRPEDQRGLRLIASTPVAEVSVSALAALWNRDLGHAEQLSARLLATSLLRRVDDDHFDLHDLVRVFARDQSLERDPPSELDSAVARLAEHLLGAAVAATSLTHPRYALDWFWATANPTQTVDEETSARWLQREQSGLLTLAFWCADHGREMLAVRLAAVLMPFLFDRGEGRTMIALTQAALLAADRVSDPRYHALAVRCLGIAQRRVGALHDARVTLGEAVDAAVAIEDLSGAVHARNHLASVLHMQGENLDAVQLFTDNLEHYRHREADQGLTQTLINLGVVRTRLGEEDEALRLLQEGVRLACEQRWIGGEQLALNNLTTLLQESGRLEEAEQAAERSLELARMLRRPLGIAYATSTLASARFDGGHVEQALELNLEARALAFEIGAEELVLMTLNNAGDYHLRVGHPQAARVEYAAAEKLARLRGDAFELDRAVAGLVASTES